MDKKLYIHIEILIVLLALAIGIYSQFPALSNTYVIHDDVRQQVYWMQQFRDSGLFRDDLLTTCAKEMTSWGTILVYYLLSSVLDPILVSKILPLILFSLSALYMFKLVRHIANNYAGFLAASIFMVTPVYLNRMGGGLPRTFGYPLLILFLYYLIKKEHVKSSIILVLQYLFYPVVFLLGALTYLFTFITFQHGRISFHKTTSKMVFFICALLICVLITWGRYGKYVLGRDPSIGKVVTREQIVHMPELQAEGRVTLYPAPPVFDVIKEKAKEGTFSFFGSGIYKRMPPIKPKALNANLLLGIVTVLLLIGIARKKISLPPEILFLFLSAILLYKISDLLLFRLFLPQRYIRYAVSPVSLIIFAVFIDWVLTHIKGIRIRKTFQVMSIILVLMNFNGVKGVGLSDISRNKDLYDYLSGLPKDTMIAAHPFLADNIPTFAKRKVFINYELSLPIFDLYWKTMKKRTYDFFGAYYAQDPAAIYRFCEENGIDYVVVDKRHFTEKDFMQDRPYFKPFDTYIMDLTGKRKDFALADIPGRDKLFEQDDIFVIRKDALKR